MIAVDTNVLVRLLTGDHLGEETAARSLFSSGSIWIAKTVLLETGWVLRSLYGFKESAIHDVPVIQRSVTGQCRRRTFNG